MQGYVAVRLERPPGEHIAEWPGAHFHLGRPSPSGGHSMSIQQRWASGLLGVGPFQAPEGWP